MKLPTRKTRAYVVSAFLKVDIAPEKLISLFIRRPDATSGIFSIRENLADHELVNRRFSILVMLSRAPHTRGDSKTPSTTNEYRPKKK